MQWVLSADAGKRHRIGLYHGDESGHLVIYCNGEVVTIDFGVLDDKTYTFFVDDELCRLEVEKGELGFSYGLKIDEKAPTERNMERRAQDKHEAQQLILWAGVFFAIIILLAILFS